MDNPFALSQGPQEASLPLDQQVPQSPAPSPPDSLTHVEALYKKARESQQTLAKVKSGLDRLVSLGDTVTVDDIVETAGKLVGGNITPEGMASLLATMPDSNPEQLMQWVGQRDEDITKRIAQNEAMTQQLRHEMGSLAIRKLGQSVAANSQSSTSETLPSGGALPGEAPQMASNVANSMGL